MYEYRNTKLSSMNIQTQKIGGISNIDPLCAGVDNSIKKCSIFSLPL